MDGNSADKKILDMQEVADYLGLSRETIKKWVQKEEIPFIRFSLKCVRFDKDDVDAWYRRKKVMPLEKPASLNRRRRGTCRLA